MNSPALFFALQVEPIFRLVPVERRFFFRDGQGLAIAVAPNVLILTLKRYTTGAFGKLNKTVRYPERLDLRPYMTRAGGEDDAPAHFRLYAVVVHLDSLGLVTSGHYVCYVRLSGDRYGRT